MSCIKIKSPSGEIRLVRSGEPYQLAPGEEVEGVDVTCGGSIVPPKTKNQERAELFKELDNEVGTGAGNWIKSLVKPLAKFVGKDGCTVCEARRIATNAYAKLKAKHGQTEALRIMKELWTMSFNEEPEAVLTKLKEYL